MSKPKFKVGEVVRVNSVISPQFNQERTVVTNVKPSLFRGGSVVSHTYQVEGQPNSYMSYREESLQKIVPELTNEQIFGIFLKKHRKYASYKRQAIFMRSIKVEDAIYNMIDWEETTEGYHYWHNLCTKWEGMCEELGIEGNINCRLI